MQSTAHLDFLWFYFFLINKNKDSSEEPLQVTAHKSVQQYNSGSQALANGYSDRLKENVCLSVRKYHIPLSPTEDRSRKKLISATTTSLAHCRNICSILSPALQQKNKKNEHAWDRYCVLQYNSLNYKLLVHRP